MRLDRILTIWTAGLFLLLGTAYTTQSAGLGLSLDQRLANAKQSGYEIVALYGGGKHILASERACNAVPSDGSAELYLHNLNSGAMKLLNVDFSSKKPPGQSLWETVCDFFGLEPGCNGFFK